MWKWAPEVEEGEKRKRQTVLYPENCLTSTVEGNKNKIRELPTTTHPGEVLNCMADGIGLIDMFV